ncbi:MAG TPA: transglutaminase-like domain-containing protein [Elusimicrobiales bacterium]|nr:transglutaminase-like domain-containing protein [Elusimicrobiales bacterium]
MRLKVLLAALAAAILFWFAQAEFIIPLGSDVPDFFVSNYGVREESPDHPRLAALRRAEKLDGIAAAGKSQFEKTVLLRGWARSRWEHPDGRFIYPPWDAAEILRLARRGNRGFCAQYAVVFLQAALSLGLHARYIDLPGHFLTAVWSDEHYKWAVMDPYLDLHYERAGVPLSGMDMHLASRRGDAGGIEAVSSSGERRPLETGELAAWSAYSILLRNDHLSEPVKVLAGGKPRALAVSGGESSYPVIGRDSVAVADTFLSFGRAGEERWADRAFTRDGDDFRRDMNSTLLFWTESAREPGTVKVLLKAENSPDFSAFLVRTQGTDWEPSPEKFAVRLSPGVNEISARILTRRGWTGRPSSLKFFYKPAWILRLRRGPALPGSV